MAFQRLMSCIIKIIFSSLEVTKQSISIFRSSFVLSLSIFIEILLHQGILTLLCSLFEVLKLVVEVSKHPDSRESAAFVYEKEQDNNIAKVL